MMISPLLLPWLCWLLPLLLGLLTQAVWIPMLRLMSWDSGCL